MKTFSFVLILTFLINCKKEKTFADDIVLSFPKDTKMKIQEFNEDMDEFGANLFYIGKVSQNIDVKYFKGFGLSPEPIQRLNESDEDYEKRINKTKDSTNTLTKQFFKIEGINTFIKKNGRISNSLTNEIVEEPIMDLPFDLLSNKTIEIIVRQNDTIPLYKKAMGTTKIKSYKAFPVFIKNISEKVLKIPATTNSSNTFLYTFDNEAKAFFLTKNYSYWFCGTGTDNYSYFELKPNEILIYAYPYFKSGTKQKAKMKFYNASSKEFEISIDEKIIKNQRDKRYE